MTTVYLALGSNVGDTHEHIKKATKHLNKVLKNLRNAPLYASKAVGYTDQPDFLNTVVVGETDLSPEDLLIKIKQIENDIGRTPTFRWGPREIDIDIIFYGQEHMESESLTIPHPSFRERDFVLKPLCDLDPTLTDPISQQTVSYLLEHLEKEQQSLIQRVD